MKGVLREIRRVRGGGRWRVPPPDGRKSKWGRELAQGSAIGVYRFWRDLGYVLGALAGGAVADLLGIEAAFIVVAALTAPSGLVVARQVPSGPGPGPGVATGHRTTYIGEAPGGASAPPRTRRPRSRAEE